MEQHIIQIGPNILRSAMALIRILLAKEIALRLMMAAAVGGLTYGILELFMNPGLKFDYATDQMPNETSTKFKISILLVIATVVPLLAAIAPIFISNRERTPFTEMMESLAIGATISVLLCWILSWALKKYIPRENRKANHFLFLEAINVILHTTGDYIAGWITKIVMTLVNLGIKIIHRPFIMEYGVIAVILNLFISFILIGIMGISKEAGAANILGSLLGGTAHYFIRRKRIQELRDKYAQGMKPTLDPEVPDEW